MYTLRSLPHFFVYFALILHCLVIWGPLTIHVNFSISLLISVTKIIWILTR